MILRNPLFLYQPGIYYFINVFLIETMRNVFYGIYVVCVLRLSNDQIGV